MDKVKGYMKNEPWTSGGDPASRKAQGSKAGEAWMPTVVGWPILTTHSHFHITRLLMVAEGASELGLQGACHLLFGGWLPFRLPSSHGCRGVKPVVRGQGSEAGGSW